MQIHVNTQGAGYDIILQRGALENCGELLNLDRKVLIVTDDGVPQSYAKTVKQSSKDAKIITLSQGEKSKSFENYKLILKTLTESGFTRTDCVVAVGGGVVGDLSGFAASTYMRGIDFYNIPTTLLSQVDSSIGGKTAIDFEGYKNIVGSFYPPKRVIIDPDLLKTLESVQVSNGLAEVIKMSLTSDSGLFEILEQGFEDIGDIIYRALLIKKSVVEQDEKETGLRKILNFGHTFAHAIESRAGFESLLHGQCVAIGMCQMCSEPVLLRLRPVLEKYNLPTALPCAISELTEAILHDKKTDADSISVIYVNEIGKYQIKKIKTSEIRCHEKLFRNQP